MSVDKAEPKSSSNSDKEKTLAPKAQSKQKELGGRDGPDPVRYGDWENNGIASDF